MGWQLSIEEKSQRQKNLEVDYKIPLFYTKSLAFP